MSSVRLSIWLEQKIENCESVSIEDLTESMANWMMKSRLVECKRMKLAVFAARIDAIRQICQLLAVKRAVRRELLERDQGSNATSARLSPPAPFSDCLHCPAA